MLTLAQSLADGILGVAVFVVVIAAIVHGGNSESTPRSTPHGTPERKDVDVHDMFPMKPPSDG